MREGGDQNSCVKRKFRSYQMLLWAMMAKGFPHPLVNIY